MSFTPAQVHAAARVFYESQTGSDNYDTSTYKGNWYLMAERALKAASDAAAKPAPPRPHVWPPATPANAPSLTEEERKVANIILSREGQRASLVTIPSPGALPGDQEYAPRVYTEQVVCEIMSRYYWDQTEPRP